jgi:hypothetical protein
VLDSLVAARLATILVAIGRTLEGEALEERISKLEQQMKGAKDGQR